MKKRLLVGLMSLIMSASAFAFVSCDDGTTELRHSKAVEATCTSEGHKEYWTDGTKYYSDKNGKTEVSYESLVIGKTPHSPASALTSTDPNGHYHKCTVCSNPADKVVEHTLETVYDTPPSEALPGLKHEECIAEGCDYETAPVVVPPTGSGEVTQLQAVSEKASTCVTAGNIAYWTDGTKFYSDAEGANEITEAQTKLQKVAHTMGELTYDSTEHWHLCAYTAEGEHDYTDGEGETDKKPHSLGNWLYDPAPTESTDGFRYKECEVVGCGYETEKETAPMTGTVSHHDAHDPTCTEDGNIEYWEKNGAYYGDAACTVALSEADRIIPASGHKWEADRDQSEHWEKCSACEEKRNVETHTCTDKVLEPTCEDGGKTTHTCDCGYSYDSDEKAALGHDNTVCTFVEDGEAQYGGRFMLACSRCGTASGQSAIPVAPDNGYYDRTVTINGTVFGAYSCYTNEELKDKGVTFDATANDGLFIIDAAMFPDGLSIAAGNTAVAVQVNGEVSVSSIAFTEGWRNGYIRGNGVLTLGSLSSVAATLFIQTDITINITNGNGPSLNATRIENGSLTLNGVGGGSAINLGEGKELTVANGGSLTINNFINGIFGNNGKLTVDGGNVAINVVKHGTGGVNIDAKAGSVYISSNEHHTVTTGWEGAGNALTMNVSGGADVTVESLGTAGDGIAALYNMNVTVDGGTLVVKGKWGFSNCSVAFEAGKATLLASNVGNNAAIRNPSAITISDNFDLGVKDFAQLVYEGSPAVDVAEGVTITTSGIKNYTYPTGEGASYCDALEQYCVEGTVTPDEILTPNA